MEVRYMPDRNGYPKMSSDELRKSFMFDNLFQPGMIELTYTDVDRAIVGSAVPAGKPLQLTASKKEMSAEYFAERREIGIINIGGKGTVKTEKAEYPMEFKDSLYIGKGTKEVIFSSADKKNPAKFYIVSYPAHTEYPTTKVEFSKAVKAELGSAETANKRTINKTILPQIVKTCQLVMGITELAPGSVWNTFPPHTHQRRMEIYMYFNMKNDALVFHYLGEPDNTRHIIMRNEQAVISPSYSIHSGVGTQSYSFIWTMGGENQEFDDMDWIDLSNFK